MDRGRSSRSLAQGQPGYILSSRLARAPLKQPTEQTNQPTDRQKHTQPSMVAHAVIQAREETE